MSATSNTRPPGPAVPDERLSLDAVRRRLAGRSGPEFWRGLEELAATPEFEELLHREFPRQASEWPQGVDRRRFLQLAGASLALGGLTACTRQPAETIVPYVSQPESLVPGKPLYYATQIEQGGYALGLLAESHMGRPTKLEGNPEHPASLGGTDLFAQGSILTLYDPDRSQTVTHLGRISTWQAFLADVRPALAGARLRILTPTVGSPSLAAALGRLVAAHPGARWHQWEPVHRGTVLAGAVAAFGAPVETRYDLSRARVVVGLDTDLLTAGPGSARYAREFAARRRARRPGDPMSRFWAAETTPTATGTLADHRLSVRGAELAALGRALAAELGVAGAAGGDGLPPRQAAWARAAAADLRRHPGAGLVVVGDYAPAALHVLAHAINARLGNAGSTVLYTDPVPADPVDPGASLDELVAAIDAGEVDVLVNLGVNLVHQAPAGVDVLSLLSKVPRRIHLGLYRDETAEFSHWHVPEAHFLESWGDGRAFDGTASLQQPLIRPLYGGKSALEVVAALAGDERPGLELVRATWREAAPAGEAFEPFWRRALHDGVVAGTAYPERSPAVRPAASAAAAAELANAATAPADGLELLFRPDPTIWDGRWANNGWLQECPKPLTKLTWDNAVLVSPALAERLGVASEDEVSLFVGEHRLDGAALWVLPGQPDGVATLHLGYGRERAGRIGNGAGVNAARLRTAAAPWSTHGLVIKRTGNRRRLASTQMHHNVAASPHQGTNLEGREADRRHLVRLATLAELERDPEVIRHFEHGPGDLSLMPGWQYEGHAWGLAVDLGACTGCNACVLACQAENNIPVVGKEQVASGREMHWIRIDRYYHGELDDPAVHHQPVMCMHCEQAPCEVVCPVAATVHSDEGLNDMVYNRCVGTRYCSNNCPYKVRRFNFLAYNDNDTPVLELLRNPDVTVRTRGVMEKCTYCVQRINAARIDARREERPLADGAIQTACQQVCPTRAIAFGDINDPDSEVSRWKSAATNYALLSELGTRPRTSYLAKITNPDPDLEGAA